MTITDNPQGADVVITCGASWTSEGKCPALHTLRMYTQCTSTHTQAHIHTYIHMYIPTTPGGDRDHLLVDQDGAIANLVSSTSSPVVVLLQAPGALVTSSFDTGAAAIVNMFLAGR